MKICVLNCSPNSIRRCTACQSCLSIRRCVFHDDWEQTFEQLYLDTDMIVYFGELHYASLGNCYKTFLERHASLGRSGIEDEVIKSYFFVMDKDADREDIAAFKTNCRTFDGLNCSFLSDICELDDAAHMTERYDKMTISYNSEVMPQNGFLKNSIRRGFAFVAATVRNRCPGDYHYFEKLGCYDPVPAFERAIWIDSPADAQFDKESRLMPFRMLLLHMHELPAIRERRKHKSQSVIERQQEAAQGALEPVCSAQLQ